MTGLGFRAKLTLAISLLILAVTGFFSLYMPRAQEAAANEGLRVRASNMATVLSKLIAPSLEFEAFDDARGHLDLLSGDDDVVEATVYGVTGEPIAEFVDEGAKRVTSFDKVAELTQHERGTLLVTATPMKSADGRAIGWLSITMTRRSVIDARATSQRNAILVSMLILLIAFFVARFITRPLVNTAQRLATLSADLISAAREQESSAAQESAAVEETRLSMETLLKSAQEIADRSSEVLGNSERSMSRNREIADKIQDLGRMFESIMQIADKTDLLALNAALEGTRAGEAGKGFALVAAEMRRLAENVMSTAEEIRALMQHMHDASESAVEAARVGTVSSEKIALLTQGQKQATEAVILSMDEMTNVLAQTLAGIQRSTASANTLADLAQVLTGMLGRENRNGAPASARSAMSAPSAAYEPGARAADDLDEVPRA